MGVSFSDVHIPFEDKKVVELLFEFLKDNKPKYVVINGDLMDCFMISKFDKSPGRGVTLQKEFEMTRGFLSLIRKICPDAEIELIAGNHEMRLRKYLLNKAIDLYGLEGLTIEDQLHLKDLNIKYTDFQEGVTQFEHNFTNVGDLFIGHFNKTSKNAGYTAKALLDDLGVSFIQGHNHKFGISTKRLLDGRQLIGVEQGCLCSLKSYMSNPNWSQGFTVFYKKRSNNRFQICPVNVVNGGFFFGDKEYNI